MEDWELDEIETIKRVLGVDTQTLTPEQMKYVIGVCAAYVEDTKDQVDDIHYASVRMAIKIMD